MSGEAKRNIELKARCPDLAATRTAAIGVGAAPAAVLEQVDTYFRVPEGRLKLREINGVRAELIQYDRSDKAELRNSDYRVVGVSDAAGMKAALGACLGVRGVVRKRRELLMYENVRIHLDEVEGLGTFLEFEAVISEGAGEEVSRERLGLLVGALGVQEEYRLAVSYSDLMGL